MHRREFLAKSIPAALGLALLSVTGCFHTNRKSGASKNGAIQPAQIDELDKLIPRLMDEAVVPGLSIALVQDGKLHWNRAFGVKDIASREPVDDRTLFEAASVSKTVFAYAVMKLCEQGLLQLDTPLTLYLSTPYLSNDPRAKLITTRHVLSHTTGFQDWRSSETPLKIHFNPGDRFSYSGEGYSYLQSVVTHLCGRVNLEDCTQYEAGFKVCATDIDPWLKRNLLTPFGMTSSGYVWNGTLARHAASPHDEAGRPLIKAKPSATDAARYASAGGLHTTAQEYAKFLMEIIDPKECDAFRLNTTSLKEMLRPQVKLPVNEKIDEADSWALGWAVQERPTGNVIVHSGGQRGFRSLAMVSVERKSGFIILTNGDNGGRIFRNSEFVDLVNPLLVRPL
jgi:CubicO group peptidase (beta-lactamase class C family)